MTSGSNNFPGLSRTKVIFQDFPGHGILKKEIQDFPGGMGTLLYVLHTSIDPCVQVSETICFYDISTIYWWTFTKLLSLVHLGTKMNWLGFGVKKSKVKVTRMTKILSETICFHNICSIYWWIIAELLLLMHLGTFVTGASWDKDELIRFWGKRSKVKVTLSQSDQQYSTSTCLPQSHQPLQWKVT